VIFNNLQASALNKYLYIFSLYRATFALIKEKTGLKENILVQYTNYLNPNYINIPISQSVVYSKDTNEILGVTDALTLPIVKTRNINPRSSIVSDNDRSIHLTLNNSTQSNLDYIIARTQFSKIGVCGPILTAKAGVSYSLMPDVQGTIFGYVGEHIYVSIDSIDYNADRTIKDINIKGSTDSLAWSDVYKITPSELTPIKIEDNSNTGLSIILHDNNGLKQYDTWKINIKTIQIDNPTITSNTDFSLLEQVSYIKFDDVSKFPLAIENISFKDIKYNNYDLCSQWFTDDMSFIVPIHSKIDTLKISAVQDEPYVANQNGLMSYNFDYRIYNLTSVLNEYASSGSIAFDTIKLDNINNVSLQLNYSLKGEQQYPHNDFITQSMFIENSIYVQSNSDRVEIPILNSGIQNRNSLEYITPVSISTGNIAKVKTRFPIDLTKPVKIYNLYDKTIINITSISASGTSDEYISFENYRNNINYVIEYTIKEYSFADIIDNDLITNTKWNKNNNICYIYYKDIKGKDCIALRNILNGKAVHFSGDCYLSITMKSVDLPYISPMVYEHTLIFN
jgi:hypothetical protein